ncbi:hypothetical protein CBL_14538 [Carabus blaptoides fortunei]
MDQPSTSGMNQSTSTYTSNSPSKIPVRIYKRKVDECTNESKTKMVKYLPTEPIVIISDDELCPEERVEEIVPQCNQVQDIRLFYKRFQDFNEKMVSLNQSMYRYLGLQDNYTRIENKLTGFLGELHYYREKEDAKNSPGGLVGWLVQDRTRQVPTVTDGGGGNGVLFSIYKITSPFVESKCNKVVEVVKSNTPGGIICGGVLGIGTGCDC